MKTMPRLEATLDADSITVNHYLSRARILQSIITGAALPALCGQRVAVEAQGGGEVSVPGAAVCPLCQLMYDALPGSEASR